MRSSSGRSHAAAAHGFTQAQHVVDVFGLCAACSRGVTRIWPEAPRCVRLMFG